MNPTRQVVVGIPHASIELPPELRGQFEPFVNDAFLRCQSDVFTDQVYGLPTVDWVAASWHRFVADPNRSPNDLRALGVVPTLAFDGRSLYRAGQAPDMDQIQNRIVSYHEPYQVALAEALRNARVFVDGHSMAAVGPASSHDRETPRPAACVGNCGDALGQALSGDIVTCDPQDLLWAGERLQVHLDRHLDQTVTVGINQPFRGGYGVRRHAAPGTGRVGIQLELNQGLWWSEASGLDAEGLARVQQALTAWFGDLETHCWKQ